MKQKYERDNPAGANPGDVLDIPTRPHKFAHFAVYPETLIEPLIKAGCPPNGVVLDPFAGSGTTGIVAERLGRNSILIEISSEYIAIIKGRIKNNEMEKWINYTDKPKTTTQYYIGKKSIWSITHP